jgi:hypothetical protein
MPKEPLTLPRGGLKSDDLSCRSHFVRCQQGVETVMGADVQDDHAGFQKPFHKLALGFFKVARKDRITANIVISQPIISSRQPRR